MAAESGQMLSHYRLVEQISKSATGVVWSAVDTRSDREVALKTLPERFVRDSHKVRKFEEEIRALAALGHPNIVVIDEIGEGQGVHFIGMELVKGGLLAERVPDGGLDLDPFLDLALPLTDAIAAAHDGGITHRNLKPGKVMVTAEGQVKVLDFGLARLRERELDRDDDPDETPTLTLTTDRTLPGTIPYMSPEQVQGRRIDHRSDIFSLGTILYEMATGKRLFEGESSADTIVAILRDQPRPATELNGALPGAIDPILLRSIDKDRKRRFQSARDLHDELSRLRDGQ
jgi:serine/threonine protein kinase